jgi:Sec-independent protein translocase protein TatA
MLGNMEILVALIVALVLFGPERLPEIALQAGEFMNQIRDAAEGRGLKG